MSEGTAGGGGAWWCTLCATYHIGGCPKLVNASGGYVQPPPDPRDATIERLTAELETWCERAVASDRDRNALADQRDSLSADLEAARAELSELRARVEAAVVELREFVAEGGYEFEAKTAPEAFLQQELKDIIARVRAILSPPEAPTEADRKGNNDE